MSGYDPMLSFVAGVNGTDEAGYLRGQAAEQTSIEHLRTQPGFNAKVQARMAEQQNSGEVPIYTPAPYARAAAEKYVMENDPEILALKPGGQLDQQININSAFDPILERNAADVAGLRAGTATDAAARASNISGFSNAFNSATAGNAGLLGDLRNAAGTADKAQAGILSSYGQTIGQANALDAQNIGNLNALNGSMRQLTAQGYIGDVSSDAGLVGQQQGVLNALGGYANGAGDVTSQAALATADAESLAAQKDVMGKLKERSDPRITDAERAMFMEARLQRETADRANRDANMSELRRKGMSGSTMALSNLNASSQEAGNTRALADTKAAGQAVTRAEAALRDYGGMANTIADQSFNRSFSTGNAADSAAKFNTQTRLGATTAQGQMASSMRGADDAIKTFNAGQKQQQQQFSDTYAAGQQAQAWQRGTDISNAGFQQSGNLATRAGNQASLGMAASDAAYGRQAGITNTGVGMNGQYLQGAGTLAGMQNQAIDSNRASKVQDVGIAQQGDKLALDRFGLTQGLVQQQQASAAEDRRAAAAAKNAGQEADKQREWEDSNRSILDWLI